MNASQSIQLDRAYGIQVAYFRSCRSTIGGENIPLIMLFRRLGNPSPHQAIEQLRTLDPAGTEYRRLKLSLPCYMLSAVTKTGGRRHEDLERHTGLLQIDLDHLGSQKAVQTRNRLGDDPYILGAWLSPGGQGVKAIMCIPPSFETHASSYRAAAAHFRNNYDLKIDPRCGDVSRLCFESHDPDCVVRDSVLVLPLPGENRTRSRRPRPEGAPPHSSASLRPASATGTASCLLHNNNGLFVDFPSLVPIYNSLVRDRLGTPQPGNRNDALVELVAGTFCAVCPRFVLGFAEAWYRANEAVFADYAFELYRYEARNLLEGCLERYSDQSLSQAEANAYSKLESEVEQAAFRISRSLAMCDSNPAFPVGRFFLSAQNLAHRLGVLDMTAWRLLRRFEEQGIIGVATKGVRRSKETPARATEWVWHLMPFIEPAS